MSYRVSVLKFLMREDIVGFEIDLGVSMLARLGRRHVADFAGVAFDKDMASFAQRGTLDWVRERRASVGGSRCEDILFESSIR